MEEAYAQLYQEFVCLRSLCLRQAALLQKLTTALKQQQGITNGDLGGLSSISQLDSEYPVYLNTTPQPPPLLTQAAACGIQEPSKNMGNFSELLAQDMSKLSVDTSVQKSDLSIPQSLTSVIALSHGAASNKCLHQNGNDTLRNMHLSGCPMSASPYTTFVHAQPQPGEAMPLPGEAMPLPGEAMPLPDSAMLSDVTLQSHVCEFCQAVFPADTTTRGQYLQHLYTHIT